MISESAVTELRRELNRLLVEQEKNKQDIAAIRTLIGELDGEGSEENPFGVSSQELSEYVHHCVMLAQKPEKIMALSTCQNNHPPVAYAVPKCPLCQSRSESNAEIQALKTQVESLQRDLTYVEQQRQPLVTNWRPDPE